MKQQGSDYAKFENLINEEIRLRNEFLIHDGERNTLKNVENIMISASGFAMPFSVYFVIQYFNANLTSAISSAEVIGFLLVSISMYLIGKLNQFKVKKKPKEKDDINVWLETNGKKLIWYEFFVRSFSILAIFFITDYKVGLLSVIYFGIFDIITLRVLAKPNSILNFKLTSFGSSCLLYGISIYASEIIYYILLQNNSTYTLKVILLRIALFLLITFLYLLRDKKKNEELNSVEIRALKFINPNVVKEVFKDDYQRLLDNLKAAKILKKIREKEDYGVEIALFRELLKKHSTTKSYYMGLLLGLFIFILASIGEGFFQDLIYEPYIKPVLCEKLNILCEFAIKK